MRIVFCWDWTNSLDVVTRMDGGKGAVLRCFARDGHEVWVTTWGEGIGYSDGLHFKLTPPGLGRGHWAKTVQELEPDIIIGWGSIDHKIFPEIRKIMPNIPLFMFLAGGGVDHPYKKLFDHFFVETLFHQADLGGPDMATKGIGVRLDHLHPQPKQPKLWDFILPASFTVNKRYTLFCDVVKAGGFKAVSVGPLNDEGCLIECQKAGVNTFAYVSRPVLRDFYCASRMTLLTPGAWGGSQRTFMESLACGIPVISCDDNFQLDWFQQIKVPARFVPPTIDFLVEAVREELKNPTDPLMLRKYVEENFSSEHYYGIVKGAIEKTLERKAHVRAS